MIAKSEIYFFGFSTIFKILLFLGFNFATPNNSGLVTLCRITFAPFFNLVQLLSFTVKF